MKLRLSPLLVSVIVYILLMVLDYGTGNPVLHAARRLYAMPVTILLLPCVLGILMRLLRQPNVLTLRFPILAKIQNAALCWSCLKDSLCLRQQRHHYHEAWWD